MKFMDQRNVRGRFAPSPTGLLHIGGARTALLAWLSVRSRGGAFVLRVEDLDQERARPEAMQQLLRDLRWLGIDWDEGPDVSGAFGPYVQSARSDRYRAAVSALQAKGALFRCFCSRAELKRLASAPHAGEAVGIYPGICRRLSARESEARAESGAQFAWRLAVPDGVVAFRDLVSGDISQDVAAVVGDYPIVRADGAFAYQLAVSVDDAEMEISEVVRADDLLDSTPRQIQLLELLGLRAPTYAHVPLVLNADGVRLAKRDGGATVDALRSAGRRPEEIVGWLAWSAGIVESAAAIKANELGPFSWSSVTRLPVRWG